jgi:hypothetical protein
MADIASLIISTLLNGPADAAAKAKITIKHKWKAEFNEKGCIKSIDSDGEFTPMADVDANLKIGGTE